MISGESPGGGGDGHRRSGGRVAKRDSAQGIPDHAILSLSLRSLHSNHRGTLRCTLRESRLGMHRQMSTSTSWKRGGCCGSNSACYLPRVRRDLTKRWTMHEAGKQDDPGANEEGRRTYMCIHSWKESRSVYITRGGWGWMPSAVCPAGHTFPILVLRCRDLPGVKQLTC